MLLPSDLAADVERVKLTQLPLNLEELSKLWSVFFQTTYRLSVAYRGTALLLDGDDPGGDALRVLSRNLYVETLREPASTRWSTRPATTCRSPSATRSACAATAQQAPVIGVRIDGEDATA